MGRVVMGGRGKKGGVAWGSLWGKWIDVREIVVYVVFLESKRSHSRFPICDSYICLPPTPFLELHPNSLKACS